MFLWIRWAIFTSLFSLTFAEAALLPLFSLETTPRNLPGYQETVNHASSIYVWQNDPALSDLSTEVRSDGTKVTGLCVPAAISNALIHQFAKTYPRADQLKLPGISRDGYSIDTSILIREIASRCQMRADGKDSDPWKAVQCIHQFYQESGYAHSQVKLIRNHGDRTEGPGIQYEERVPELQDIIEGIRGGYQVIMSMAFMRFDQATQTWKKISGHAVNAVGFAKRNSLTSELTLIIQNPTRNYEMNFRDPVFDLAELKVNSSLRVAPDPYSTIEVSGAYGTKLNFEGTRTFIAGLILMKAQ